MSFQVPTTPLPQRGGSPQAAVAVFIAVLAVVVGVGVSGRGEAPAPRPTHVAVAEPTSAPTRTVRPTVVPTPAPAAPPHCTIEPLTPVSVPLPRHPRSLAPTGLETVTSSATAVTTVVSDRDGSTWAFGAGHLVHLEGQPADPATWTFSDDALFDATGVAPADGGGVWLFGVGGLAWFDGSGFLDTIPSPAPMAGLGAAAEAPDGSLWAATWDSRLWRWDGRAWSRVDDCAGGDDPVNRLVIASDGALWAARGQGGPFGRQGGGLSRFDGTTWWHFGAADSAVLDANQISALETGPDGSVWVGTDRGAVRMDRNGVVESADKRPGIVAIAPGAPGGAWLASTGDLSSWGPSTLRVRHVGRSVGLGDAETELPSPGRGSPWSTALRYTEEGLVAATTNGLVRFERGAWHALIPTPGPSWVGAILARSVSDAWAANGEGIWRVTDGRWTSVTTEQPLSGVSDVARGPNGSIWAATGSGVALFRDDRWRLQGLDTQTISVTSAPDGTAWIGMGGGRVAHVRFDGKTLSVVEVPTSPIYDVQTIAIGRDGTVWAGWCACGPGTLPGLARFDGRTWQEVHPPGMTGTVGATKIVVAPNGDVWFALTEQPEGVGVVARLHGEKWTVFGPADGAPTNAAAVAAAPDGTVWIAGDGISRFDGRQWTTRLQGHWFGAMSVAPDGTLFVAGPSGLQRLTRLP